MELTSNHVGESVACRDPECADAAGNPSAAEPEQDGEHRYYACTTCGFAFGFERAQAVAVNSAGTCAVGIPEDLRRRASAAMEGALAATPPPLLLQIGRRPDAPAT